LAATKSQSEFNDGRPPDTTDSLLAENSRPKKKLGRPTNSPNINKDPHTTFMSYLAQDTIKLRNRCWLSAALESLYAIFTPIWLTKPGGKKIDLYDSIRRHFSARATLEMTNSKSLRRILNAGSNNLFEEAQKLHPESFEYGKFASCDFFLEIALDPKNTGSAEVLTRLFLVNETRSFTCPNQHGSISHT